MDEQDRWKDVAVAVEMARAITWDRCHKIYILMDEDQVRLERSLGGPDVLIHAHLADPGEMLTYLRNWYDQSCSLRFISSVTTTVNPMDGYVQLIPQFWGDEDEVVD